jgi:hypothetical protein
MMRKEYVALAPDFLEHRLLAEEWLIEPPGGTAVR